MERDYFIFYKSFYEAIKGLNKDIRLEVLTAIAEYGLYGETPAGLKPFASSIFTLVKPNLDACITRYNNGQKGGRPKAQTRKAAETELAAETVPQPSPAPVETPTTSPDFPLSDDNAAWLAVFFDDSNSENLTLVCKNFGFKSKDIPRLRTLAEVVVAEWELSHTQHHDYSDWSRHLIASMRIKNRNSDIPPSAPAPEDYTFGGGFGGQDA